VTCVFSFVVASITRSNSDRGWVRAHTVEEAKWRRVYTSVLVPCCNECNWTRNNERRHKSMQSSDGCLGDHEFHRRFPNKQLPRLTVLTGKPNH
jgi:hypothetical protein